MRRKVGGGVIQSRVEARMRPMRPQGRSGPSPESPDHQKVDELVPKRLDPKTVF